MKPPEPSGMTTVSGPSGPEGSLLAAATTSVPGARPDTDAFAVTSATGTSLRFGGQRVQGCGGIPKMLGSVVSILTVTEAEFNSPAALLAVQVSFTPAVSAVRMFVPQPDEDTIVDPGLVTLQLTVTLLTYQPFFPSVPVTWGTMTGGVTSTPNTSRTRPPSLIKTFPWSSRATEIVFDN